MRKRNPGDIELFALAAIGFYAWRAGWLNKLPIGTPSDTPAFRWPWETMPASNAPDTFRILSAERAFGPQQAPDPLTGAVNYDVVIRIAHRGPGAAGYKLQAWLDQPGFFIYRPMTASGETVLDLANDTDEREYSVYMSLKGAVTGAYLTGGVWDVTAKVTTMNGNLVGQEARFSGVYVL